MLLGTRRRDPGASKFGECNSAAPAAFFADGALSISWPAYGGRLARRGYRI
jgi:hypothetical protein